MKKIYLFIFFMVFICTQSNAEQHTVRLNTFYPSHYGAYSKLQLVPKAFTENNPCRIGTLYFKSDGKFRCCQTGGSGDGSWQQSVLWGKNGDNVFLEDSTNKKIGIGTIAPEFKLTLENDGGILAKGTFHSGVNLLTSGAGSRLIWYPKKAAFRAGVVDANQWDDGNIGDYSFASGNSTTASGSYSSALGCRTIASGFGDVVLGYQSSSTLAVGSIALGFKTMANGRNDLAMGSETKSSADDAAAIGYKSIATGRYSIAMGYNSEANTTGGAAMGYKAKVDGGDLGANSFAIGTESFSSRCDAIGTRAVSKGTFSTAIGNGASAIGHFASVAIGNSTNAIGYTSTAIGNDSTANGYRSFAIGADVISDGEESFALGRFVTARAYRSFVFGRYNIISGDKTNWVDTDPLFVIGNGTDDANRSNAVTVLKNGNVGIKTDAPKARLHIMGVQEYADNTAALAAGLNIGDFYRTVGELKIVH